MSDIVFGDPFEFIVGGQATQLVAAPLNSTQIVIAYVYGEEGIALIATESNGQISFGSTTTFAASGTVWTQEGIGIDILDETHFFVVYIKKVGGSGEHLYAKAGSVSGSTISFGAEVNLSNATANFGANIKAAVSLDQYCLTNFAFN